MAMTFLRALRSRPLLTAAGAALFLLVVLALFVSDLPTTTPAQAAGEAPKIDPIAVNGPIFVDWPKPTLAIVITGELDGYLEPCGCAGLENQLGGLKRRHSFFKQLEADGWPVVKLDLGGLTKRSGEQSEIKYKYALESFVMMGYDAVALGANDVKQRTEYLAFAMENVDPAKSPVVSSNLGMYGFDAAADMGSARFRIIEKGGKKVGVAAVLGAMHEALVKNRPDDFEYVPPAVALAAIAPQLAAEQCDVQVLLVHGNRQEAEALSRQFSQFQIVATAGGAEEPPGQPAIVQGSGAVLMEAGHKGMYATVLAFFDDADPAKRNRYQRVPLDVRFPDAPEMQAQLVKYQKELETMTLAGLGLTGVAHPDGEFAGSEACAECHTAAWAKFEQTPHAHALDTLVKLDPPRHFDPECLSCHVTGWNPQEYFPYITGYMNLEATPHMKQNGCENCHGPAAHHVKVESGEVEATEAETEQLRAALRMKIVPNEGNKEGQEFERGQVVKNCMQCHDVDNSPDFDFQKYWPEVEHKGKD
jgi:hypothetical protein